MENEEIIGKLKRQVLLHRVFMAAFVLSLVSWWAYARYQDTRSLIIVDGKPVVCVTSERDANDVLHQIKTKAGGNTSKIEFKQDVCVARAPRGTSPVSRHMALRVIERSVTLVVPRWSIIVNGKPAVAVPSRQIAGEVIDLAKLKFGKLVKNLAEEPQFKEKVTVDVAAIDPAIYRNTAQEAVDFLLSPAPAISKDAVYAVRKGDVAGSIASRCGIKLARLVAMNPGVDLNHLKIDQNIRVKASESGKPRVTVIVRDQAEEIQRIPAPVRQVSSEKIVEGKQTLLVAGKDGSKKVNVATIYENGRKTGSEVISEEIIHEAVPKQIAVGIKHVH